MNSTAVAIVVYGLTENWLGGVNYYRNLVSVFDEAGEHGLRLHVLTDDPAFFADLPLSPRVQVHRLAMLQSRSPAWVLRKALLTTLRRDVMLIAQLQRLDARAAVFCHVSGASAAGIRCLPWLKQNTAARRCGCATATASSSAARPRVTMRGPITAPTRHACT